MTYIIVAAVIILAVALIMGKRKRAAVISKAEDLVDDVKDKLDRR